MSSPGQALLSVLLMLGLGARIFAGDDPDRILSRELRVKPTGADAQAAWPLYGGTIHRNPSNPLERGFPASWGVGKDRTNIQWVAELGRVNHSCLSVLHSCPVIAGGRIFVGTNNQKPRDPKAVGDKGVLMCFRESDGKFLWQAVHDTLGDEAHDWGNQGISSTPAVDGDRLYYVSNRCELVCADVAGDEKTGKARIVWTLDMIKDLKVQPHHVSVSSPLVVGDLVFVLTGNGVEEMRQTVRNPEAPSFVAINKQTGKVVWKDNSPGKNILAGQWANPVAAEVKGVMQVIFPGGDGWLYSFEAKTGNLLWKFDCNPKASVYKRGGLGDRNYLVATAVVWKNKLYVGVGQRTEDGTGVGHLWCIDITKEPKNKDKDLSPVGDNFDSKAAVNKDSGLVWHYGGYLTPRPKGERDVQFGRTVSTVCIHEGLLYAAEVDGYLHCLDARTGTKYWEDDLQDATWSSPFYADGKVYLGTSAGDVVVYRHGKEALRLATMEMNDPLQHSAIAVNGVLYLKTGSRLYAIASKKK